MISIIRFLGALQLLLLPDRVVGLVSCKTGTARTLSARQRADSFFNKRASGAGGRCRTGGEATSRLSSCFKDRDAESPHQVPSLQPSKWYHPRRWVTKLLQKRIPSKRKLLVSIILGALIILAPSACSAISAAACTEPPIADMALRSRALGTFPLLPTKAELELAFRLVYAACTGAFVGLERSSSDRPAGVRTMALVGLGACIFAIVSAHGFLPHALGYPPGHAALRNVKFDPSRMAANVASGVGFIGAGAIHKSNQKEHSCGLTTAAAIWCSAAVGVASAVGMYFLGAVASLSTVAILKFAKFREGGVGSSDRDSGGVAAADAREQRTGPGFVEEMHRNTQLKHSSDKTTDLRSIPSYEELIARYYSENYPPPIIIGADGASISEVERYIQSRLSKSDGGDNGVAVQNLQEYLGQRRPVLIEEEQQIVMSYKNRTHDGDFHGKP